MSSASDDEVWDTLIKQLPEYLRKRLDTQLRAAREQVMRLTTENGNP